MSGDVTKIEKMQMLVKDATAARAACVFGISDGALKSFRDIENSACSELMDMVLSGGAEGVLLLAELLEDDRLKNSGDTFCVIRDAAILHRKNTNRT